MIPLCVFPELILGQLFMAPAEINEPVYVHNALSMACASATDCLFDMCFIDTALSPVHSQRNLYNLSAISSEIISLVAAFQYDECLSCSSSSSGENGFAKQVHSETGKVCLAAASV
jgi:hypothetical protein